MGAVGNYGMLEAMLCKKDGHGPVHVHVKKTKASLVRGRGAAAHDQWAVGLGYWPCSDLVGPRLLAS